LRALLWGATHNLRRATLWASRAGQFIAILLILSSGAMYLMGLGISGMWNVLIGLFLWNAATNGYRQSLMLETLRHATVGDLMTRDVTTVSPDLSIAEFVDSHLLQHRNQTFSVSDGFAVQGMIGIDNVRRVPRADWTLRRVRDAMQKIAPGLTLDPSQTAADALARLTASEDIELPVIQAGQVIGFLGEHELSRYLKLKAE
jgi:CBS domain-containing protein